MDQVASFLGREGYLPHGYCFTWNPGLLWAMVASDAFIAAAYFSIPLAILTFLRKRGDSSLNWVAWLFSAFIFACGLTHVMDIWTIWRPDYGLQALSKGLTAAISIGTAVALWRLIPQALKIPSVAQLHGVIASLEAEIQQRRKAEDQLADTQEALLVTLASIGAGFIATDREGHVTRMNQAAESITNLKQDQALGRKLSQVFEREGHPPESEQRNPVDVMIETGATIDDVQRVVAVGAQGTRTSVEVQSALMRAADGSVRGLAMVFRDMTRLNLAEAESSRLAAIVASSHDAIIGKTLDGRITTWNQAAQAMFGYSAEEAIGQTVQMLIPPDRKDEETRILTELAAGAAVPSFDTVRRCKDGSPIDVSVSISPIRDARGRIVGASKIARDISSQKRDQLALQESQTRLRFALEAAQVGDWDLDFATNVTRRSPRHDRCFGYTEPLDHWDVTAFLAHVHPEDRPWVQRILDGVVERLEDWHLDCRVVWPDHTIHWISAHGSVLRENGRPTRMLGIVADITQQKQAEALRLDAERLAAENRQIQEATRLKSEFLANMSHELRTPLNAIIGFADLLHAGAVPTQSPKHQVFLGHIGTSGRHLLQLIDDVLDLSKVEAGKLEFYPEPVRLPVLVGEITDILEATATRAGVIMRTDLDPAAGDMLADPARLKQVLYNYLSNAIKFTPDGGLVTLRTRAEGPDQIRLEVEDSGIGIAPADLARLFVEFQQLDSGYTKRHQGTGLGLSLTRRLVEAQGGSVGVRSTLGVGSVFHAILPRRADTGQALERPDPSSAPVAQSVLRRFLLIQDDVAEQHRMAQALSEAGFEVDIAMTRQQAVASTMRTSYEAIALDLAMAGGGGLDVLSAIRSQAANPASPVRAMTMKTALRAVARFHVHDVLSKPIHAEHIVDALRQIGLPSVARSRVMVVDDEATALELMHATLNAAGIEAICLADGRQALREMDLHRPDALILDLIMPGFDGFAVLDALRRQPAWKHLPVFIWTSMQLSPADYDALASSAHAILGKGGGALDSLLEGLSCHGAGNGLAMDEGPA